MAGGQDRRLQIGADGAPITEPSERLLGVAAAASGLPASVKSQPSRVAIWV